MMLTPSIKVERSGLELIQTKQVSGPPWKHYARGMLPISPTAKKSRGSKSWDHACDFETQRNRSLDKRTFDQEDNKQENLVTRVIPHNNITSERSPQKQNNRNAMLKRLAHCFACKQGIVKSGAKKHRVLGFYPRLYTIHENASELAHDLDATYNSINSDTYDSRDLLAPPITKDCSFDHRVSESTRCCQTNDQKIAALHEDIKELWKRLENVEREFAWARDSLVTAVVTPQPRRRWQREDL